MFDQELIKRKFNQIGADVVFLTLDSLPRFRRREMAVPVSIDVKQAKRKEYFEILYNGDTEFDLSVIDVRPDDKHLLMMVKIPLTNKLGQVISEDKIKLLCGHDERHYFSCGVPEKIGASNVKEAKKALLPNEFISAHKKRGKAKNLLKRKNETGRRQGEWIFVKDENFVPANPHMIKKNEPISRGRGSKPHICEEVYNFGGDKVYVHRKYAPDGVTEGQMTQIRQRLFAEGIRGRVDFQVRTKNAKVYARGHVRHSDHKTIYLREWHAVYMNKENESKASRFSVFLD
ncbi:MAG: hypothetical protein HF978_06650 [Desulfobacteraceae bacterium]|nr:hypothetical protein [Desulfobacteraceae bacterium]MBC2755211.1 hypothetical protein [Desulfobacteraceae bacterium]